MGTRATRVERALEREGLRHHIQGIENNTATPGEVVLWPYGEPVYSVREALDFVRSIARAAEEGIS